MRGNLENCKKIVLIALLKMTDRSDLRNVSGIFIFYNTAIGPRTLLVMILLLLSLVMKLTRATEW